MLTEGIDCNVSQVLVKISILNFILSSYYQDVIYCSDDCISTFTHVLYSNISISYHSHCHIFYFYFTTLDNFSYFADNTTSVKSEA